MSFLKNLFFFMLYMNVTAEESLEFKLGLLNLRLCRERAYFFENNNPRLGTKGSEISL